LRIAGEKNYFALIAAFAKAGKNLIKYLCDLFVFIASIHSILLEYIRGNPVSLNLVFGTPTSVNAFSPNNDAWLKSF
jgi:hypothetical protein